jgi:hypothetical protein
MSNFDNEYDKILNHLEVLERRHKELDIEIETRYNNITVSDEVRKKKTMKLWLKDEIYRINQQLVRMSLK